MIREIVHIDEDKCDGCGLCVPNCHEGALRIVNGKAKLVADKLCDGLGACLGHCPRGAITIERREANVFDEVAVKQHLAAPAALATPHGPTPCNCPGGRFMELERQTSRVCPTGPAGAAPAVSELTHWPVQLGLLAPQAPVLRGASLLIAADCVPVACPDFHQRLLRGRAVVIGCPKFDDVGDYVERLTEIIRLNALREIVVARMEVPCCAGIVAAAVEARRQAGIHVPITEIIVGRQGEIRNERPLPSDVPIPAGTSPAVP